MKVPWPGGMVSRPLDVTRMPVAFPVWMLIAPGAELRVTLGGFGEPTLTVVVMVAGPEIVCDRAASETSNIEANAVVDINHRRNPSRKAAPSARAFTPRLRINFPYRACAHARRLATTAAQKV